jgi:TRAP-type C4-dicarboxylate transport system permease large subunit
MKKIKSPWYGIGWIAVWTIALGWFLLSGLFNQRESIGLIAVWAVLVGTTVYVIYRYVKIHGWNWSATKSQTSSKIVLPALNGPCPCGSGKKYKRCCKA